MNSWRFEIKANNYDGTEFAGEGDFRFQVRYHNLQKAGSSSESKTYNYDTVRLSQAEYERLKQPNQTVQNKLEQRNQNIKSLQNTLDQKNERINELQNTISQLRDRISELESTVERLNQTESPPQKDKSQEKAKPKRQNIPDKGEKKGFVEGIFAMFS